MHRGRFLTGSATTILATSSSNLLGYSSAKSQNTVTEGKHIQKSTGQGNHRAARQMEAAFRTALVKGEVGIMERKRIPSFKQALDDFLSWSAHEHQSHPETHRRYRVSSVALLRHFKDTPLDKITPEHVERFKAARSAENKTVRAGRNKRKQISKRLRPATVNRELACLKAVFNYAIKSDIPLRNPASRVKFLKEQNEQTRVLTYDEQESYLKAATPRLRDVATLMLETGMRPEEVFRIRRENVFLASGYLFNPYGKTKAARRQIALTGAAKEVLIRRINGAEPYLFPCETNPTRPVPKVNNAHDRAVRDAKVAPFRLYDLRHTWATRAARSGIDLVQWQPCWAIPESKWCSDTLTRLSSIRHKPCNA
ncbi:tyrosine-type recombinase/integrase [Alloacidobacterium dinghuense]|uniref:Tyrosine-type recombinase/integrase n=1 Tax=Alloacidobacterium dinghuense TaxID=2763107 RepID=A0A7G8BF30_9BACT|nr:tyrosine-type recombinase/integrase [Alloacidobacterium dinghuense]QNI31150.1 tyrosine-type recombinase/integrase [Alloacidobacterium dinghuense]